MFPLKLQASSDWSRVGHLAGPRYQLPMPREVGTQARCRIQFGQNRYWHQRLLICCQKCQEPPGVRDLCCLDSSCKHTIASVIVSHYLTHLYHMSPLMFHMSLHSIICECQAATDLVNG